MKIDELPDKEFKMIVLLKLSKLLENTDKQSMKSRKQYMNKRRDSTESQKS